MDETDCYSDLTDREVGIVRTTCIVVLQSLSDMPAPAQVGGKMMIEAERTLMDHGRDALMEMFSELIGPLIVQNARETKRIAPKPPENPA